MALLNKTKTELVNIILRKDDVEKRLKDKVNLLEKEKKQLIEESEKMKRTRKISRNIAISVVLASLCVVAVVLSACNTPKQAAVEDEPTQTFPELLHQWAGEYDINDPQRLALIDLVDSVYYLMMDSTVSAEILEEPIGKMKRQIENVILTDSVFEFTQMMRASARYIGYCNAFDTNRNTKSLYELGFDLITDSFLWQTYKDETMDLMYTSLFDKSWEAMKRKANIILSATDDDHMASVVLTNYCDTTMDNIRIAFDDEDGNPMGVIFEHDCLVDSSRADSGVKEMFIPLDVLMRCINTSSTWNITYETGTDTVTLAGVPNYFFSEQLKDCPRLLKILK